MGIVLCTIGFSGRTAQSFFEALAANEVRTVLDIRLRPSGQLAGFAKQQDLPYFLDRLANGCAYRHLLELAPTDEMLNAYRQSKDWDAYMLSFRALLGERGIPAALDPAQFDHGCLLCSEPTADRCHRGVVASVLEEAWPGLEVRHL